MADWGDMPPPSQQPMTPVRALLLAIMAIGHVRDESQDVGDWGQAERYMRLLLKQAREAERQNVLQCNRGDPHERKCSRLGGEST